MPSSAARAGAEPLSAAAARVRAHWRPLRSGSAVVPTPCFTCRARSLCVLGPLQSDHALPADGLVLTTKRVHSGEHLFRAGDPFSSLYAFRSGFFKSYAVTASGRSQVTAFPMAGDLVGMDGLGSGTHVQNVSALQTGEACVVPYAQLQKRIGAFSRLDHKLNRIMSHEIVREQHLLTLLGTMGGEAKVAAFLLSLANRLAARGHSATEIHLQMSRAEIGSYLGLAFETVSRIVSRLQDTGLIRKKGRRVRIVDLQGLRAVAKDERAWMRKAAWRTAQITSTQRPRGETGGVVSLRLLA